METVKDVSLESMASGATQRLMMGIQAGDLKTIDALLENRQEGKGNVLVQDDLNSALFEACKEGRKFIVQKLKRFGADVNVKMLDQNNMTPLHVAAQKGFIDIADFLLSKGGADINAVDNDGNTALILAMNRAGSCDMLNLLVPRGADCEHQNNEGVTALMRAVELMDIDAMGILIHAQRAVGNKKNRKVETARDVAVKLGIVDVFDSFVEEVKNCDYGHKALTTAVLKDRCAAVKILLDCRSFHLDTRETVRQRDETQNTLAAHALNELIKSVCSGGENNKDVSAAKLEIAESLVASGIDAQSLSYSYWGIDNARSALHRTLLAATRSGMYELVKVVCKVKHMMNVNEKRDQSALMVAAEIGRSDIVELLLSFGADPASEIYNGDMALKFALMGGHIDCAQILLQRHKPCEEKLETIARKVVEKGLLDSLEFLSLHINFGKISQSFMRLGISSGDTKIVQFLLDHGANVNGSDKELPALLFALIERDLHNRPEMVKFLIQSGDNVNRTASFDSPLITAIINENGAISLRILIEHGANVNEAGDEHGRTPLTSALEYVYTDRSKELSQTIEILLKAHADPNKTNRAGESPLHLAVENGNPDVVKQLIVAGADLEGRDPHGMTPLLLAAKSLKSETISVLKECGVNMKAVDKCGRNALILVSEQHRWHEETFRLLLLEKDQVNVQSTDGLTPLIVAARVSNYKAIDLLLEAGADTNLCGAGQQTALDILLSTNLLKDVDIGSLKSLIKCGALHSLSKNRCLPLYVKIMQGDRELVQLLVTHGMAPMCVDAREMKQSPPFNRVIETVLSNFSPLAAALVEERIPIARYLLENWFLTHCDVVGSTQLRDVRASLSNINRESASLKFLDDHLAQPMRLVQLSFVSVSAQLGEMKGREERVRKLPLPIVWQNKLLFKTELYPMDFETESESRAQEGDNSSVGMNYLQALIMLQGFQERREGFARSYHYDSDDNDYYSYVVDDYDDDDEYEYPYEMDDY